jgi:cellulose synthase/poly-beta-1,6-N-acetylglucosamine synthase-like glycosyltransferase
MTHSYLSLGQDTRKLNYARVYSGYYETGRNRVPYLVLVKMGQPREAHEKERAAGNRGKRDSLLIVMSFLERCMNLANNRITPLEYELFNQCYNVLGIDPRSFKYLMVTDADTQVQGDVVQMMVTRMERDRKLLAVSGHVRPANPEQNLTTMLQIFPVYMTFFSGLAYEACLKSVMTINGGLVMYKIWTDNLPVQKEKSRFLSWQLQRSKTTSTSQQAIHSKWPKVSDEINPFQDDDDDESLSSTRQTNSRLSLSASIDIRPCCVHPTVLRGLATPQPNTMHMQNVLLLGEDRYLSTLLLQSHPHHRLGFEPDAVGYVTLPTHFLSLVGHQVRNIRAGFHTRLEQHRVTWQLGVTYWILSTSEILDMIFSMPIIVYLYGIFGRSLKNMGQAYVIIACSFTGLVVLHMLFFLLRRQFRYILWFVLYCLISVPLFAVLFPLLAAWQSDYAERWYDVWPTTAGRGTRLHGIIDRSATLKQQGEPHQENEEEEEDNKEKKKDEKSMTDDVPRLRLGEYEVAEAKRLNQAAEAALDSNFTGFTGFASEPSSIHSNQSNEKQDNLISTPPLVQVREGIHSTRLAGYQHKNNLDGLWRNREERRHSNDNANPFADPIAENPFDDEFGAMEETIRTKHKPTQSQSSYFTFLSNDLKADTVDGSTLPSSLNSSGFAKIPAYGDVLSYKESTETEPSPEEDQDVQDRASTLSIISNTFSISSAHSNEHRLPQHHRFGAADTPQPSLDEGRHTAIHTNMSSNMRHVNTSNVSLRHTGANVGSSPLRTRRKKGLLVAPSNSSLSHHYRHQSIDDGSDMKLVLRNEVRNYLQQANLDLITRAQVKQHLVTLFGSKIEQEEWLEYVNECIEETTLSFMSESTQ